jgi:hypothetical protein
MGSHDDLVAAGGIYSRLHASWVGAVGRIPETTAG